MQKYTVVLAAILAVCLLTMADAASAAPLTPEVSPTRPTRSTPAPAPQIYIVEPGDTFWHIAQAHGLGLDELGAANPNTKPAMLVVGQRLVIPVPGSLAQAEGATRPATGPLDRYVVENGDTFWDIAVKHGVTVADLALVNPLTSPANLVVGQELRLPRGAVLRTPTPSPAPTQPAPAPAVTSSVAVSETTSVEQSIEAVTEIDTETAPDQSQPLVELEQVATTPEAEGETETEAAPVEAEAFAEPLVTLDSESLPSPDLAPALITANLPEEIQAWPQLVASLINELRAEAGLPALAWSSTLAQAAQDHAMDCTARGWCSHIGSDGDRLRKRLQDAGYAAEFSSENWVYTHGPERAVRWWFNEPPGADPHRANILSRQYTEIGVGIAVGKWGLYYFVADFARP